MSHSDNVSDTFVIKHPIGAITADTSRAPMKVFLPSLGKSSNESQLKIIKKGYHPLTLVGMGGCKVNGKDIVVIGNKKSMSTINLKHDGAHWTG